MTDINFKPPTFLGRAIQSLSPETEYRIYGDEPILYSSIEFETECSATQKEIEDEAKKLEAEYDAQQYARNRATDYPDMGEQFNKIYDDGLTKWKSEMVDPIKTKWPKDNSGPVE